MTEMTLGTTTTLQSPRVSRLPILARDGRLRIPPSWRTPLLLLFSILPVPVRAESDGDEFSNNLFSDLAPLLALFGEEVAKQFMSESLGWSDNIIFAMAPLGIITAMVGAIRVGGPTWLKAIIGRARENRATAEMELMSSTSRETCELWNGSQIVRVMGAPGVAQLIYAPTRDGMRLWNLEEAKREGVLEEIDPVTKGAREGNHMTDEKEVDPEWSGSARTGTKKGIVPPAPNISLNIHQQRSRTELRIVAVVGILVQLSVFAFTTWTSFYAKGGWREKGDKAVQSYAFPLFIAGTIILCTGMLICSYIIESGSKETRYRVKGPPVYLLWIQKQQPVSDQHFDSYAVFAKGKRDMIITSHPNELRFRSIDRTSVLSSEVWAVIGTAVSLVGFICQFVGLRGMHFSASIAQLIATIIMAALRAWVRRGLSERPLTAKLPSGHELDWLATKLVHDAEDLWGKANLDHQSSSLKSFLTVRGSTTSESPMKKGVEEGKEYFRWEAAGYRDSSGQDLKFKSDMISSSRAQRVLQVRRRLGALTGWSGAGSDAASSLGRAIGRVLDHLELDGEHGPVYWPVNAGGGQVVEFGLEQSASGYWNINRWDLEAALSLRLFGMRDRESRWQSLVARLDNTEEGNSLRILSRLQYSVKKVNLQLLVVNVDHSLREFQWWLGDSYRRLLAIWRDEEKRLFEIPEHRVVGASLLPASNQPFYWDAVLSEDDGTNSTSSLNEKRKKRKIALGLMSDAPLETLYAREFLLAFIQVAASSSTFVWANEQAKVLPLTSLRAANDAGSSSGFSFTLECSSLTKMVSEIEETGLGSFVEVQLIVITPLLSKGLLPEMTVMVEFAREKARPYEVAGKWAEAGKIFKEMFTACMRTNASKTVRAKAASAFVEFYRSFSIATALQLEQKGDGMEKLETLRKELVELLKVVKPGLLNTMAKMYELQGRGPRTKSLLEAVWRPQELRLPTGERALNLIKALVDTPQMAFTALHEKAAISGRKKDKERLIRLSDATDLYLITACDISGWTPLHYATLRGEEDNVVTLLQLGADANARDLTEWTPLHYAALVRDVSVGWALLQQGIDVNVQGRDGLSPLHCAAMSNNVEMLELLIESGSQLDVQDNLRRTPLHWAAYFGHRVAADALCGRGAQMQAREDQGRTPMHLAAMRGESGVIALLLDKGVDINGKDRVGQTPLHIAVEYGQRTVAKLLLGRGAQIEFRDRHGYTPLYSAVKCGQDAIVELLCEAGAQVERRGNDGKNWWSPIQLAAVLGHTNIGRILLKHGARLGSLDGLARSPLHHAAGRGHLDFVAMLVRRKAWINARDKFGRTPLEYATYRKHPEVIQYLKDHGAVLESDEEKDEEECGLGSGSEGFDLSEEGLEKISRRQLWENVAKTTKVKPADLNEREYTTEAAEEE